MAAKGRLIFGQKGGRLNREQAERLRAGVRQAYSAAAERPEASHPFPVGRDFAVSLGYPVTLFADLPTVALEAFSGVSNVAIFATIPAAATVLDLGCGAGLDALIAARRLGPAGRVVGIDFSTAMLARARQAIAEARASNAVFMRADAERLPLANRVIDVALVNGVFNLNPARQTIFHELARVIHHGGTVYAAELVLQAPLPRQMQDSVAHWFA